MISQKRYLRIKQNLEFIISDVCKNIEGAHFDELVFKMCDIKDIDHIVNYSYNNNNNYNLKIDVFILDSIFEQSIIFGTDKKTFLKEYQKLNYNYKF